MVGCALLVVAAACCAYRWRKTPFSVDLVPHAGPPSVSAAVTSYARLVGAGALGGILTGLTVVGPGGRLVMRLLAATSPRAQGRRTEADEVVGAITLDGTLAFFVFVGLPIGLALGLGFVLVHAALPQGVLGGLAFGAVALVVLGVSVEPLRPDNEDFAIVGPGWLAVVSFAALALGAGAFVSAAAGRLQVLLRTPDRKALLAVSPLAVLALPTIVFLWPLLVVVVAGGTVFVAFHTAPVLRTMRPGRGSRALQVMVVLAVAVSLPAFFSALREIAG